VVHRFQQALDQPMIIDKREIFVTASIGIALPDREHETVGSLLRDADLAMYQAKARGKDRYMVFDQAMTRHAVERLDLSNDLRRALERRELRIVYQPIFELATGRIDSVEALLRWRHPKRGEIPPSTFITIAEETGQIIHIGRWMLKETCLQARAWGRVFEQPALPICVNLSARQFQASDLLADLQTAAGEAGIEPSRLRVEITETAIMRDSHSASEQVEALRALGVQVAIDDFGAGRSSLVHLKHLSVDYLKIDPSFIQGVGQREQDDVLAMGILTLAHGLGLRVIAEGIETAEQVTALVALGCDLGQGYHLGRPMSDAEMTSFLARHEPLLEDEEPVPPRIIRLPDRASRARANERVSDG